MRLANIVGGFLLGAAIGAGVVLLLTPRSGADLRQGIRERIDTVMEEGRQAASQRRAELLAELEARKQFQPAV
jgi:gas vesicle protein